MQRTLRVSPRSHHRQGHQAPVSTRSSAHSLSSAAVTVQGGLETGAALQLAASFSFFLVILLHRIETITGNSCKQFSHYKGPGNKENKAGLCGSSSCFKVLPYFFLHFQISRGVEKFEEKGQRRPNQQLTDVSQTSLCNITIG